MCVDCDPAFLRSTGELLRVEGHFCEHAPDVASAIDLLCSQPYDFLIVEVKMPRNDELRLLKELPKIMAGLPVILVTDYPSIEMALQSIQLPVAPYLVKPVEAKEFLALVRKCIDDARALHHVRQDIGVAHMNRLSR